MYFGVVLYTAAFIAEIVRGGILAVPKGQTEAAQAVGLRRVTMLRRVILPQAFRVILPPLGNQYLNLTKNTSLAIAIGYTDIVQVGQTVYNQTGKTLEVVSHLDAVLPGLLADHLGGGQLLQRPSQDRGALRWACRWSPAR